MSLNTSVIFRLQFQQVMLVSWFSRYGLWNQESEVWPGTSVKVDKEGDNYRIVCSMCCEFLDQPPRLGGCPEHWLRRYLRKDDNIY